MNEKNNSDAVRLILLVFFAAVLGLAIPVLGAVKDENKRLLTEGENKDIKE